MKWFDFSMEELRDLIIVILVLGFAFSFRDWGEDVFSVSEGIRNLVFTTLIVALSFLIFLGIIKWFGEKHSIQITYFAYWPFVIATLLFVFLTDGYFVFAALLTISFVFSERIGTKFPFISQKEKGEIGMNFSLSVFLLMVIGLFLNIVFPHYIWQKLFIINAFIGFLNLIPFYHITTLFMGNFPRLAYKRKRLAVEKTKFLIGELMFFSKPEIWAAAVGLIGGFIGIILLIGPAHLSFLSLIFSVSFASLLACILFILWHYYLVPWKK